MQPDRRTERTKWCWVYGTRDTEKDIMQPDRRTERTKWCWFHGTRDTERIQICSKIGGQRGQYGVGFMEQEIQKGYRYAARYTRTEKTERCWVYGTRDTEKYTDMQPDT